MQPDERVGVIKDRDGHFVNPKYQSLFTGLCTGFTGYTNEDALKKHLEMLGEGYYAEYINIREIPDGERVYLD